MPLFFLIAIGLGAFTLGATTVDVVEDGPLGKTYVQAGPPQTFQPNAYATLNDCLNAAAQQGIPASACQRR